MAQNINKQYDLGGIKIVTHGNLQISENLDKAKDFKKFETKSKKNHNSQKLKDSKSEENLTMANELKNDDFRVAIFGSARTKKGDAVYNRVFELAKEIGKHNLDMVTGGGPGLMEAANAGHEAGDKTNKSDNIGLTIELPWEAQGNKHLELRKHFEKFSNRLDHFIALSSAMVVMPGGIGTCLELFYTWQLVQVKHITPIPIILFGDMWEKLYDWVKESPVKDGLISPEDLEHIHVVKTNKEALAVILKAKEKFEKQDKKCHNQYRYKINYYN